MVEKIVRKTTPCSIGLEASIKCVIIKDNEANKRGVPCKGQHAPVTRGFNTVSSKGHFHFTQRQDLSQKKVYLTLSQSIFTCWSVVADIHYYGTFIYIHVTHTLNSSLRPQKGFQRTFLTADMLALSHFRGCIPRRLHFNDWITAAQLVCPIFKASTNMSNKHIFPSP